MFWDIAIVICLSVVFGLIIGSIGCKTRDRIKVLEKENEDFLNPEYAERHSFRKNHRIPIVQNERGVFYRTFIKDEDNFVEVLWDYERELFAVHFGSRTKRQLYSSNIKLVEKTSIEDLPRIS